MTTRGSGPGEAPMPRCERIALVRQPSPSIARCELTHLARQPIDLELAREQHAAYIALLAELGCRVERLPDAPELADAVFVEDAAVVVDELAVLCRPGAASRRAEVASVAAALAPHRECVAIEAPGTLDGGDVLVAGRRVWVGRTSRSNESGARQLRSALAPLGYDVQVVPVRGCLHLKSAATALDEGAILANPERVDPAAFDGLEVVAVDPLEPDAANVLALGKTLVSAEHHPRTRALLKRRGYAVRAVPATEIAKAEGAVTCCSIVFGAGVGSGR